MSESNLLWSILDHGGDLVKTRFSLSLTPKEQAKFEEEFKYLIVTSSLFNDTLKPATTTITSSLEHPQKVNQPHISGKQKDNLTTRDPTLQNILMTSIINVIISTFILTKFNTFSTIFLLFPVYTILCYFTYRYQKHTQIRKIHASAIDSLHDIVTISEDSDQLLYRLFSLAHDLQDEGKDEGATQSSETDQIIKSLGILLSLHLQSYMGMVKALEPLVDKHNLARFRDMYNIKEKMPAQLTLNNADDPNSTFRLEDIDLMNTMITWKRREYLLYLLALEVMSTESLNTKQQQGQPALITNTTYYSQSWIKAIEANRHLVDEYRTFNASLTQLMDKNISSISSDDNSSLQSSSIVNDLDIQKRRSKTNSMNSKTHTNTDEMTTSSRFDGRALALMHRISAIEKLMEDMQAGLFLCKQDTRLVSANSNNNNRRISSSSQYHLMERLQKRFEQMDREITNLSHQWEESKQSLDYFLSSTSASASTSLSEDETTTGNGSKRDVLLPSPPASPSLYFYNHHNKSLASDVGSTLETSPSLATSYKSVNLQRSHTYSGGRPSSLHQHRKLQHIRFGQMAPPPAPSTIDDTKAQQQLLKKDTTLTLNAMEPNLLMK